MNRTIRLSGTLSGLPFFIRCRHRHVLQIVHRVNAMRRADVLRVFDARVRGHSIILAGHRNSGGERQKALERERMLLRELYHRSQNMLAVVQSIIRRTLDGQSDPEEAKHLLSWIYAMAEVQQVLLKNIWEGADLRKIIEAGVGAFSSRLTVTGCDLLVKREAAQQLVLIFHELATNAFKHGALVPPRGRARCGARRSREETFSRGVARGAEVNHANGLLWDQFTCPEEQQAMNRLRFIVRLLSSDGHYPFLEEFSVSDHRAFAALQPARAAQSMGSTPHHFATNKAIVPVIRLTDARLTRSSKP